MTRSFPESGDLFSPAPPLPPASAPTERDLMQLADELRASTFAMPLSLLLSSHLPLRGLAVAALDTFGPLLSFILSERARRILTQALEDPSSWQAFLDRLNRGSDN